MTIDYASGPQVPDRAPLTDLLGRDRAVVGVNGDLFNWKDGHPSGMLMQKGGNFRGALALRPHAQRQRWDAAEQQPAVERRGNAARRRLVCA